IMTMSYGICQLLCRRHDFVPSENLQMKFMTRLWSVVKPPSQTGNDEFAHQSSSLPGSRISNAGWRCVVKPGRLCHADVIQAPNSIGGHPIPGSPADSWNLTAGACRRHGRLLRAKSKGSGDRDHPRAAYAYLGIQRHISGSDDQGSPWTKNCCYPYQRTENIQ